MSIPVVSTTVSKLLHSSAIRRAKETVAALKGVAKKATSKTPLLDRLTFLYEEIHGLKHHGKAEPDDFELREEDVRFVLGTSGGDPTTAPQMLATLQQKRAAAATSTAKLASFITNGEWQAKLKPMHAELDRLTGGKSAPPKFLTHAEGMAHQAKLSQQIAAAKARPKTQPAPRAIVTPAAASKTPHFEQLERLKGNERTKYYNAHKAEIMAEARRIS